MTRQDVRPSSAERSTTTVRVPLTIERTLWDDISARAATLGVTKSAVTEHLLRRAFGIAPLPSGLVPLTRQATARSPSPDEIPTRSVSGTTGPD